MTNIWRCSKGHSITLPDGIDYSSFRFDFLWPGAPNGKQTAETQVCPICFENWIDANIPQMRPVIGPATKDEANPKSVREKAEADATKFLDRIRPGCIIVGIIITLIGVFGLILIRCH